MSRFCKECRYVEAVDLHRGQCRKNPPTAFLAGAQGLAGTMQPVIIPAWPPVNLEKDWCGEFLFKTEAS